MSDTGELGQRERRVVMACGLFELTDTDRALIHAVALAGDDAADALADLIARLRRPAGAAERDQGRREGEQLARTLIRYRDRHGHG